VLGLVALTVTALAGPAEPFGSDASGHDAPSASATSAVFVGVMGQVARPGVYEFAEPRPTLGDVLRRAGGLTRRATGAVRVVRGGRAGQQVFVDPNDPSSHPFAGSPLRDGDILVADAAPNHQAEARDAESEPVPVALVGVLPRPVILPVPPPHAHLASVLAFLGQDLGMAPDVRVLTVGRAAGAAVHAELGPWFRAPTVLEFPPRSVHRESLPDLPAALTPPDAPATLDEPPVASPTVPLETEPVADAPRELSTTAERPPLMVAPPATAPALPALPELPGLPTTVDEPPAAEPATIARIREMEQALAGRSNTEPPASPTGAAELPPSPDVTAAPQADTEPAVTAKPPVVAAMNHAPRREPSASGAAWLAVGIGALAVGMMLLVLRSQHRLAAARKAGAVAVERSRRMDHAEPSRAREKSPHFLRSARPARTAATTPPQPPPVPQPVPPSVPVQPTKPPAEPPAAPLQGAGRFDRALARLDGDDFRRAA
jgi:hypothetical protein